MKKPPGPWPTSGGSESFSAVGIWALCDLQGTQLVHTGKAEDAQAEGNCGETTNTHAATSGRART